MVSGELTFAAAFDDRAPQLTIVDASPRSVTVHRFDDGRNTVFVHLIASGIDVPLLSAPAHAVVGSWLYYQEPRPGGGYGPAPYGAYNLDTGEQRTLGNYGGYIGPNAVRFLTGTGDGWVTATQTSEGAQVATLTLHRFDGSTVDYPNPPVIGDVADGNGMLATVSSSAPTNTPSTAYYLDFHAPPASAWHPLSAAPAYLAYASMSTHALAYMTASQSVVRLDRQTLSTVAAYPMPSGVPSGVAVTDSATALGSTDQMLTCLVGQSCVPVLDGLEHQMGHTPAGLSNVGDTFIGAFGDTAQTRALRLVAPGSPHAGTVIVAAGHTGPASIYDTPGYVGYVVNKAGRSALVSQSLVRQGGSVTVGSSPTVAPFAPGPNTRPATSGTSVALIRGSGPGNVVVTSGATALFQKTVGNYPGIVTLSGNRLAVATASSTYVYDLNQPSLAPVRLPGVGEIFGDRVAFRGNQTSVYVADLARPHTRPVQLRAPVTNGIDATKPADRVQIHGDWVLWTFATYGDPATEVGHPIAVHLRADDTVDRTITLPNPVNEVRLLDGLVAYTTPDDTVHLFNLTSGTDQTFGSTAPHTNNRLYLAADDETIAWVGADNLIHVIPTPGTPDAGPRLLGVLAPTTYSLTSHSSAVAHSQSFATPSRAVVIRVDASRPISNWHWVLRDARGHVIAGRSGTSASGAMITRWTPTQPGRYHWALTAQGAGGKLSTRLGHPATARGTLIVTR